MSMNYFLAAATGDHTKVLLTLFIMLVAAKLMAELFERLRQPAVAGEILAGVIIGPSLLGWAAPSEITSLLAEIGVIFLLFTVGLETKPAAIFKVGKQAAVVAVLGVVAPLFGGWLLMKAWGSTSIEALFVGTAMVATSVGITARVLSGMGLLDAPTARIILGAAVIDDILGLLVLAIVSSMAAGTVNYLEILTTAGLAIGFTAFVALVGAPLVTRVAPSVERMRSGQGIFIFGLVLCLGLSVAASYIGVAAIIGAFLAGMALAEAAEDNPKMHRQMSGVTEFLVPFFLVNIGMQLTLERLSLFIGNHTLRTSYLGRDCDQVVRLRFGRLQPRNETRRSSGNGNGATRRSGNHRGPDWFKPCGDWSRTLRRCFVHGCGHDRNCATVP